ncbi:hypothetical protein CRG86_002700 [Photobacterium leiognathi]|uniref:hypothetical protein n=1 Tax=Photobacterium leiognathi TaxID=553611 RepID=UPI000C3DE220|nr:hypothetical protein [Photobacterium leiognathi]PHZ60170.1 hypothetical protein CRG86_002700 [Photobacterium leiognathi]
MPSIVAIEQRGSDVMLSTMKFYAARLVSILNYLLVNVLDLTSKFVKLIKVDLRHMSDRFKGTTC